MLDVGDVAFAADAGEEAFSVGLSFNGIPSKLTVPYRAVTQFHDPAVNFALQFQALGATSGPEPHDTPQNDGPTITAEDGSNVVSVDFKRKK